MPRREPDGDTGVEVAIDRIRDIERELEDLKAFVAGKLPHDHDSRYVNESGDTMTGTLDLTPGQAIEHRDPDNNSALWHLQRSNSSGDRVAIWRSRTAAGAISAQVLLYTSDDQSSHAGKVRIFPDGADVVVEGPFTATGAKNAEIVDPNDPTKGWHFAAVEADEPGLLIHRATVTIPTGAGEATVALPAHWSRIARDGDAMVTPLDDTRDQAPAAAAVDLTVPEVTVRGKPGDYRVWVMAARADAGVDGWTHEVEVSPDDEDV